MKQNLCIFLLIIFAPTSKSSNQFFPLSMRKNKLHVEALKSPAATALMIEMIRLQQAKISEANPLSSKQYDYAIEALDKKRNQIITEFKRKEGKERNYSFIQCDKKASWFQ